MLRFQSGDCLDAAEGSGDLSSCSSGPTIGVPGAYLVGGLSVLAAGCAVARLIGALRGR